MITKLWRRWFRRYTQADWTIGHTRLPETKDGDKLDPAVQIGGGEVHPCPQDDSISRLCEELETYVKYGGTK